MTELSREVFLELPRHLPGALALYVAIVAGIAYVAALMAEESARTAFTVVAVGIVVGLLLFPFAYQQAKDYCESKQTKVAGMTIYTDPRCAEVFPIDQGSPYR